MELFADYHTHTRHSHGKGTVLDNVARAAQIGLEEIAITDHGPRHMLGIGIRSLAVLDKTRSEIEAAAAVYPHVKVKLGVEANVTSIRGDIDVAPEYIEKLDLLLVGLHLMVKPEQWLDGLNRAAAHFLRGLTPGLKRKARLLNTEALVNAVNRHPIQIVTHPGHRFDIDTRALARACAARGAAFEINTSHQHMTVSLIKTAANEGVKFAISSDAHQPSRVGDFAYGVWLAGQAGLTPEMIVNAR
ncbi:MAG: PHP domain-containing protein [Limnochordia bacterium]|jgi:putative hydrolase|nr:PHP domain-containing protein [Bacillota bacterium]NLH30597.1 PHP domain-containing protein [Bacillota bacterium]HOB09322.1 PHP domain-containing protein [Limnochordia bacterium]HPZ30136.1 PHP domain-containing protein [Limnochordia bacterium]HQD70121.1 PHP domain-containing protein [Limnochordia bacterium]